MMKQLALALPAPDRKGGIPLMQALEKRKTVRAYSDREIPMQTLSNLLWAASGVNRADGGMTAPTARNLQEITLYVLLPAGIFRYDAPANRLVRISAENITGQVTGKAPLTVVLCGGSQETAEAGTVRGGLRIHQPEHLSLLRVRRTRHGGARKF